MAIKYVSAQFGDNTNNDGNTANTAYSTITKAVTSTSTSDTIYVAEGKYVENLPILITNVKTLIGVGKVVLDGTIFNNLRASENGTYYNLTNVIIKNYLNCRSRSGGVRPGHTDCYFHNVGINAVPNNAPSTYERCVFNSNKTMTFVNAAGTAGDYVRNCSFFGTTVNLNLPDETYVNECLYNIFHSCTITLNSIYTGKLKYQHFYNCYIDFPADSIGSVLYNGMGGDDPFTGRTIGALRNRAQLLYGGVAADYFPYCKVYYYSTDCYFNSSSTEKAGFNLLPGSPSAQANYQTGKYIGALPVAYGFTFPTGYTYGSNINASGGVINVNDNTPSNNTIEYTAWKDVGSIVLAESINIGITDAERNGHKASYDRNTDIDANRIGNGATLTNGAIYVCEVESLSLSNKINLSVGQNYTTPETGTITITANNGLLRKLLPTEPTDVLIKVARTVGEQSTAVWLRYFVPAYNGTTIMSPMCHIDSNGLPILGDADDGFTYDSHATYGAPVRLQFRYFLMKDIIQLNNAKS